MRYRIFLMEFFLLLARSFANFPRPCASVLIFNLKKPFHIFFALLVCLQLVGGQYAIMQIYAWGNMLTSYSKESGLLQGAKDTFSGEKPCGLCCKIAEAKKSNPEKKQGSPAPTSPAKLPTDFLIDSEETLVAPFSTTAPPIVFFGQLFQDGTSVYAPPVPPPQRGI